MFDISFIIPVYNVQQYIEQCIESVKGLTEYASQIICIDDNSTDNSYDVLLQLNTGEGFEIYKNDSNLGLSRTRNRGIELAKGEYICFVDSDDYIEPKNIEYIIDFAKQEKLDLVFFDMLELDVANGTVSEKRKRKGEYEICSGASLCAKMQKNREMFGSACSILIRRSFLVQNGIKFIEGILHEDIPFTFECLLKAKRAAVMPVLGYYYRQRSGSIIHQENFSRRIHGLIRAYFRMLELCDENFSQIEGLNIKDSIDEYLDSVVDLIHYDLEQCKFAQRDFIVNNFFNNFVVKESREAERILNGVTIDELRKFNKIALYGAGRYARKTLSYFSECGVEVSGILVTQKDETNQRFDRFEVEEFSSKTAEQYDVIILAVSYNLQIEILKKINESKYEGRIISRVSSDC